MIGLVAGVLLGATLAGAAPAGAVGGAAPATGTVSPSPGTVSPSTAASPASPSPASPPPVSPPMPPTQTVPAAPGADASGAVPPHPIGVGSALKADQQAITVLLRGTDAGSTLWAQQGDAAPVQMADRGRGVLEAELIGPQARFLQLRLIVGIGKERTPVYDGLVVLPDRDRDTLAFQFQDGEAVRIPVAPSAQVELALDQRVTWWVSFGWGALASGWVGLLGVLWSRTRR